MITWTYDNPPYLESGPELYNDMVAAYQNGAKYILVFDYPKNNATYEILQEEHLEALKQFWQYIKSIPEQTIQLTIEWRTFFQRIMGMVFGDPTTRFGDYGKQTTFRVKYGAM
jgi:hypothetical protein